MDYQDKILKDFFEEHVDLLTDQYPGLTLKYLLQVSSEYSKSLSCFFDALKKGIPLEYLINQSYFYEAHFFVNEHVLIPRSETEILVELALDEIKENSAIKNIVDVGTGQGVIPLSIAMKSKRPLHLIGLDISKEALNVAKINQFRLSQRFSKTQSINFFESDRLANFNERADMVISNPPYIMFEHDRVSVHKNVSKFEPRLALFLPDGEYFDWFKTFFHEVKEKLNSGGVFLMEGSEMHLDALKEIMLDYTFKNIEIINDYTNRPRFIRAYR